MLRVISSSAGSHWGYSRWAQPAQAFLNAARREQCSTPLRSRLRYLYGLDALNSTNVGGSILFQISHIHRGHELWGRFTSTASSNHHSMPILAAYRQLPGVPLLPLHIAKEAEPLAAHTPCARSPFSFGLRTFYSGIDSNFALDGTAVSCAASPS